MRRWNADFSSPTTHTQTRKQRINMNALSGFYFLLPLSLGLLSAIFSVEQFRRTEFLFINSFATCIRFFAIKFHQRNLFHFFSSSLNHLFLSSSLSPVSTQPVPVEILNVFCNFGEIQLKRNHSDRILALSANEKKKKQKRTQRQQLQWQSLSDIRVRSPLCAPSFDYIFTFARCKASSKAQRCVSLE